MRVTRSAPPKDAAAIRDVHVGAVLGLGSTHYTRIELESWAAGLTPEVYAWAMGEGGETMEVAQDGAGRIVAFCARKGDEVMAVYVHPDAARRGLGSLLLGRAEAAVVAEGHRTIRIGASLSGRPLYEARGYRVVKEVGWETRGGLVIAACDMEKTV